MKVVTFGEIMMRLQPQNNDRFLQAKSFDIVFGGGEANVAVSLSQLDNEVSFLTALPKNDLGKSCEMELKKWGVDTSKIIKNNNRLGIYFCEKGYGVRPSIVIYDRENSAFSNLSKEDINIEKVLKNVEWFHFTGITPAINDNLADILVNILEYCKKNNIIVSCDLNYRAKLWTREKAKKVMSNLMQYVDVLIANEEDCSDVFGIHASETNIENGKLSIDGYKSICKSVEEMFNIKTVAITLRESFSASVNGWSALLMQNGEFFVSEKYNLHVLDRVGGGDSFSAGLIDALGRKLIGKNAIDFAVACSAIKHTINGDFNILNKNEVEKLMKSGGNGRVQR